MYKILPVVLMLSSTASSAHYKEMVVKVWDRGDYEESLPRCFRYHTCGKTIHYGYRSKSLYGTITFDPPPPTWRQYVVPRGPKKYQGRPFEAYQGVYE